MRVLFLLLLPVLGISGCAPSREAGSDEKSYSNLVELRSPNRPHWQNAKIYIDSVRLLSCKDRQKLLVSGRFPNGCTYLGRASYTINNGMPALSLSAWSDAGMACTQVLTPFSFIFDKVKQGDLQNQSSVLVNGTIYKLK